MESDDGPGDGTTRCRSAGERDETEHCGQAVMLPPSIEDFTILKPISRGAFGKVFLGKKKGRDQLLAIKVMKKSELVNKNMASQIQAERDALAVAKSPFVVHLFYSIQSTHYVYLIMEYMVGGDLKSLLHLFGFLDTDVALVYTAEVVLALEYLHNIGIIHRDLKPDNMLVGRDGHIRLTDFGLSKVDIDHEIGPSDLTQTPIIRRSDVAQNYFRTPGQVLSLTSKLFTPAAPVYGGRTETDRHQEPSTPLTALDRELHRSYRHGNPAGHPSLEGETSSLTESPSDSPSRGEGVRRRNVQVTFANRSRMSGGSTASDRTVCSRTPRSLLSFDKSNNTPLSANRDGPSYIGDTPNFGLRGSQGGSGRISQPRFSSIHDDSPDTTLGMLSADSDGTVFNMTDPGGPDDDGGGEEDKENTSCIGTVSTPNKRAVFANSAENIIMQTPSQESVVNFKRPRIGSYGKSSQIRSTPGIGRSSEIRSTPGIARMPRKRTLSKLGSPPDQPNTKVVLQSDTHHTGLTSEFNIIKLETGSRISPVMASCSSGVPTENGAVPPGRDSLMTDVSTKTPRISNELGGALPSSTHDTGLTLKSEITKLETDSKNSLMALGRPRDSLREETISLGRDTPMTDVAMKTPEASSRLRGGGLGDPSPRQGSAISPCGEGMCSLKSPEGCQKSSPPGKDSTSINRPLFQTPFRTPARTPFRTPKSCRRGPGPSEMESERILGTPDYLAPEILQREPHGPAVDWWALGVCLFEFLTGVPPFNDQSAELVFQNILNRDLPWPENEEELESAAHELIDVLLTMDPQRRPGATVVKEHPFFANIDWDQVLEMEPPFIPSPDDELDTTYFEAKNQAVNLRLSSFSL